MGEAWGGGEMGYWTLQVDMGILVSKFGLIGWFGLFTLIDLVVLVWYNGLLGLMAGPCQSGFYDFNYNFFVIVIFIVIFILYKYGSL